MTVYLDEEKIEVNIDSVTNDFHELRKVMDYLQIEIKEAM